MKFGPVPIREAAGLIAAHSVKAGAVSLRKGNPIPPEVAVRLQDEGVREVVAVTLEPGDVGEDAAAERLAGQLLGPGLRRDAPFTGRCNLFATRNGLLQVGRSGIDAVNSVDEAITVATLAPFKPVVAGEMVATVKIIPYAVPGFLLEEACGAARPGLLGVAPYRLARVGVVSTVLPGLKDATIDKTLRNLRRRLAPTGAEIATERRVPHAREAVARALAQVIEAGAEIAVIFGASAIADRRDVIPAGIEAAGGTVAHLGMPVDPGNLLLVGARGGVPVIGAPGCARSPKENGFDWVLHRLLAGLPVTRADIVGLGVGGLLMEIVSRPQPRAGGASAETEEDDA
ncbi:molybdopterin-binding protein [Methylobacterium planeticum]|uniref:Molybdopterin-binding protein n=1 Tax=Methylobacterium planeticum TaxID=2615211 RepID=A0A6N6MYK5_9HYPH|nr:molybdopterin-binding protein [Methylobacterium planeticum]KAB1075297.1 molybdopterin-binding protein [Methylobacterium planeticum]